MKKFLIIFVAVFLSAPAFAKICMTNNPTTMATQGQIAALDARIDALENISWLSSWSGASGALSNSSTSYVNNQSGVWSVTASQGMTGIKTVGGSSMCSSTHGNVRGSKGNPSASAGSYCWCKMTSPRLGAWVFFYDAYGQASVCALNCAYRCANDVQTDPAFRASVLAL